MGSLKRDLGEGNLDGLLPFFNGRLRLVHTRAPALDGEMRVEGWMAGWEEMKGNETLLPTSREVTRWHEMGIGTALSVTPEGLDNRQETLVPHPGSTHWLRSARYPPFILLISLFYAR